MNLQDLKEWAMGLLYDQKRRMPGQADYEKWPRDNLKVYGNTEPNWKKLIDSQDPEYPKKI